MISTHNILNVLSTYNVRPAKDERINIDLPEIGKVDEGETLYSTSINRVLSQQENIEKLIDPFLDDQHLREWWYDIDTIIRERSMDFLISDQTNSLPRTPPEPHCAWYHPIHFFGLNWGIFLREDCILSIAKEIARYVDWRSVKVAQWKICWDLLRSSFYVLFLHEQFHHKVESFGFRLLVSTGTDHYRPYKSNVYRPTYLTHNCLEESLANAESYRRLSEARYSIRVISEIRAGVRRFLKTSFKMQPPGYREGMHYLSESNYRKGLYNLQSRILDETASPTTQTQSWTIAPNMIKSLANIADEIYVVLPIGRTPIFSPTSASPAPPLLAGR